jgi:hypothetical protein
LISRKKWPPGPETAVPRAIQGNRSYHGLTDQFNVSYGSISNVMKLFIALGGVIHRFTKKKLQIATSKQDELLVWLSKMASHSDQVEFKTDLQTKNMISASATTAERRLRDADSYACDPVTKYLIQENNWIGRLMIIASLYCDITTVTPSHCTFILLPSRPLFC